MSERKYRVMQCVCEGKTKSVGIYDCGPGDICCRSDENYYVIMSVMATDYQDAKWQVLEKIETSSTLTWLREWIRPDIPAPTNREQRLEAAIRAHRDALGDFYEEADMRLWEELKK